ncbi:hypothetical protein RIR_jg1519.t1 [Rhizophagus irregularis DAOM 181602=DAOM 197198]|nr:hypothetical protein RIR_jg1519.t1 [Rhizophagus irregularis DAOM 181602=DAOM 197198]
MMMVKTIVTKYLSETKYGHWSIISVLDSINDIKSKLGNSLWNQTRIGLRMEDLLPDFHSESEPKLIMLNHHARQTKKLILITKTKTNKAREIIIGNKNFTPSDESEDDESSLTSANDEDEDGDNDDIS